MAHRRAAAAGLLLVLAAACSAGPPDHVRIGLVAPLTGQRAYLGSEMLNGARHAVEDINDGGGLLGAPVELDVVDDADLVSLPGQLADLAERQRVTAVIGPEAPGVLLGPRSPLGRRQVPAVLPSAFAGDLRQAPTTVVRTVPSARAQGETLGRWLAGTRRIPAAALLVADPIEGAAARGAVQDGLEAGGVEVTATVEAGGDTSQLAPAVARLRAAAGQAGAVVLWGPPPAAARATRAVRDLGWDVQVAVPASAFVAEYRTLAGPASENVVFAFPFRREWFGPELESWLVRYHSEHGLGALPQLSTLVLDIPVAAVAAYDAVNVVAAAVREAGSRRPAAVGDALGQVTHDGILREYRFDGPEAYTPEDLYVARFHAYATVYDADPRLDPEQQRRFWETQVRARYIPESVLRGPAGELIRRLVAEGRARAPDYAPPDPPPGPLGAMLRGGG